MRNGLLILLFLTLFVPLATFAQNHTLQTAQPAVMNAEDYILKTYDSVNIIGISEGLHGLENSHAFFTKLFDNSAIQKTVNILIVEFGSIAYQDVLDNYILGKDVDIKELQNVWRESGGNTTGNWDRPMYMRLLTQIRGINLKLTDRNKIRVLAADPAIDWKSVRTIHDYFKYLPQRDLSPAHLAIEYGISRNQKVLMIYGGTHFPKLSDETKDSSYWTITSIVNKRMPGSMKVIEILNPKNFKMNDTAFNFPLYSIVDLSQSPIGNLSSESLFPETTNQKGQKMIPYPGYNIKDLYDAFLYVGPSKSWTIADIAKAVFLDDEYWNELNRRSAIVWGQALDKNLRE